MNIFRRLGDILSANFDDMADRWEDPEKMLKQAIREMEQSIGEAEASTAKTMASEKLLARELQSNEDQVRDCLDRASKSVAAGDDEGARKALQRKGEHQKLVTVLKDQLAAMRESIAALRGQLDGMKSKLAEAKRNLATLSARTKAADFRKRLSSGLPESTIRGDAFAKFDRLREKVEMTEAEAEALCELRGVARSDETAKAASDKAVENIEEQLAELKRRASG